MQNENLPRWSETELLAAIRQRPGMYLGTKSLTALWHFSQGYGMALSNYGLPDQNALGIPHEMHDWVAYRLGYRESTAGWINMITEHHPAENEALKVFFELLDEYRDRVPHTFALIENIDRQYQIGMGDEATLHPYPRCIDLVTYGDYRGFFAVTADDEQWFARRGFYPFLSRFERFTPFRREQFTVVDEALYSRIVQEDED